MQSILNQLVYFSYFQSLFLLCIYLLFPKNRKNINGYIVFFVLILSIGLSGRVLYISGIFEQDYRLVVFSEFSTLLFGATIFLFTRSSLSGKYFSYSDLLHYAPAFLYNICILLFFILPADDIIRARTQSGEQYRIILTFVGIGLIFNTTYWILSLRLFLNFRKEIQNELSYTIKTQFFFYFLIAIGLCILSWLTMYFLSIVGYQILNRSTWQLIWLSIASIILFIAYYNMIAPDLFMVMPLVKTKKYTQSKFSKTELDNLQTKLDQLMAEKKPYLNRKLLKAELADMLGVSSPEIARLLNENIGMNFFEYINYYRIKEFVELAKTDKAKNLTFFGLAQEAGFNSKTTFNKSFKNLMGTSPKEYFANS